MKSFNNDIIVQQGEDWNLDILLSSSQVEYVPFLVSSERTNPFFVVTIASTKYEKNLRYVASWWNNLDTPTRKFPRFYQTTPFDIGPFPDLASVPSTMPGADEPMAALYRFTITTEAIDIKTGHRPWHYVYYERLKDLSIVKHVDDYECRIRFNFGTSITENWGSQNYMYQITLVSGQLLKDTLSEIAIAHKIPDNWPDTIEEQYQYVKLHWPDALQPDIDVTSPLGRIESPQTILTPTKLQVENNLRQLI